MARRLVYLQIREHLKRSNIEMRHLILACAFSTLASAAWASPHDELPAALSAFVDEEIENATPERKEAIAACLLTAFDGVSDEVVTAALAEDDFEDGLGVLVGAHPEREQILESCEEI
jgi:hypothetical protein